MDRKSKSPSGRTSPLSNQNAGPSIRPGVSFDSYSIEGLPFLNGRICVLRFTGASLAANARTTSKSSPRYQKTIVIPQVPVRFQHERDSKPEVLAEDPSRRDRQWAFHQLFAQCLRQSDQPPSLRKDVRDAGNSMNLLEDAAVPVLSANVRHGCQVYLADCFPSADH